MNDFYYFQIIILISAVFFAGCKNQAQESAGAGALIGGGVGQVAGDDFESTAAGAAIGAGVGYILGENAENDRKVEQNPDEYTKRRFYNSDGTARTIAMKKKGDGYVGPEGEYYKDVPSKQILKERYGH